MGNRGADHTSLVVVAVAFAGLFGCTAISGAASLVTTDDPAKGADVVAEQNPASPAKTTVPTGTDAGAGSPGSDGTPGTPGTATSSSGGGGGATGIITCDNAKCDATSQYCCAADNEVETCNAHGAACQGAVITCDGLSNCPGSESCCFTASTMKAVCTADACAGPQQLRFCVTDADCPKTHICVEAAGTFDHAVCY